MKYNELRIKKFSYLIKKIIFIDSYLFMSIIPNKEIEMFSY